MVSEIHDITGDANRSFVDAALRHRLLRQAQVPRILAHADDERTSAADASLALGILKSHEVDAIGLLSEPRKLAPGYELRGLLGVGSGGLVFQARQDVLQRDVALKTIISDSPASSSRQSRLQREAHAIASLQHPHIVAVYDSGLAKGRNWIAMEWVRGQSLAEKIEQEGRLSETLAWRIARQIAAGLAHAAQSDIIHRDIKPGNVLLTQPPSGSDLATGVPFAKVADFGLALFAEQFASHSITATGATLGTPAYVAPEQLQDTRVDVRADIYSLGATVFHMLTGRAPLAGLSPMRAIMQKTIGDDSWRDEMPASVSMRTQELFRAMTHADPGDRIDNYSDLLQRVDELLIALESETTRTVESARPAVKQRPDSLAVRSRGLRSFALQPAVLSVLLLATSLGFAAMVTTFRVRDESSISPSSWVSVGLARPLFNGISVPIELQESGVWSPGVAPDGSRVLVGQTDGKLLVPLNIEGSDERDVRLRVSVHFPGTSRLRLAIVSDEDSHEISLARLTGDQAVALDDLRARGRLIDETIPFDSMLSDDVAFHGLVISRFDNEFVLQIDGHLLGHVALADLEDVSLRIECEAGPLHLADFDIVPLVAEAS